MLSAGKIEMFEKYFIIMILKKTAWRYFYKNFKSR